jgi:predicted nucleotide-binding protein (sugar kinase/HSP70/actin superfamily)
MGSIRLVLQPMLETLGCEVIAPPEPSAATVARGARLAPETMCLPFKVTLGNILWCAEHGADTLVYVGGSWSCRFGYYGRLQADILRDLGFRCDMIELRHDELPQLGRHIVRLNRGSLTRAAFRSLRALRVGWLKSTAVEEAESQARRARPYVREPGSCRELLRQVLDEARRASGPARLVRLRASLGQRFAALARNGRERALRVKLVGESYCTLEPFVNFDVVRRLGEMGVEVDPFLTAHRWLGFHGARFGRDEVSRARAAASRYWRYCAGGEDESSLGHAILAAHQGFDGVVHVHPFACMPSTVVLPAVTRVCRDAGIPLLSVSLDEHTSESGFVTRLEAFVSLLEKARRRKDLRPAPRDGNIGHV